MSRGNERVSTPWDVLTFGTDSSLTTAVGWDNVTGVLTPNGQAFVNASGTCPVSRFTRQVELGRVLIDYHRSPMP